MEVLRNWIRDYINAAASLCLDELPEAKGHRQPRLKLVQPQKNGNGFRIEVDNRQAVQVVRWQDSESPIEAILSDSVSTIKGRFSSESVTEYARKKKADVRSNTKGATMKLTDFDIIIGRNRTSKPFIALYIRNFDIMGCEGSGTFGNPRDILKYPSISALVEKCLAAGETGDSKGQSSTTETNSVPSVAVAIVEGPRSSQTSRSSQAAISTQIDKEKNLDLLKRSKSMPMNSPTILTSQEILTHLPSNKQSRRQPSNLNTSALSPSTSSESGNRDKGSMPPPPRPSSRASIKSHGPSPDSPSPSGLTFPQPKETKNKETLPEADAVQPASPRASTPSVRQNQNQKTQSSPSVPAAPRDRPSDNNTAEVNSSYPSPAKSVTRRKGDIIDDSDPWKNWKRITRRDVFIPQDQQELIDRSDSWVPPPAGQTLAPGRVPIKLLQRWNELQTKSRGVEDAPEIQNEDNHDPDEQKEPSVAHESINSSSPPNSSSGSELGESEWSLSPERSNTRHLPPDSSPIKLTPRQEFRISNNTRTAESVRNHTEELPDLDVGTNHPNAPRTDIATFEEATVPGSEHSDISDIELSVVRGLEASTQENQACLELTQDESVTSSGPPLPPSKGASFTQVKQSPETAPTHGQTRVKPIQPGNRKGQRDLPAEDANETSKLTSDIVIPATFGSDNARKRPQDVDMTEELAEDPPLTSSSNGPDSDGVNAGNQLISELGGFIQETASQAKNTGFHDPVSTMDTENIADTPCPNSRRTVLSKRKRDSSDSGRPRSPKRRIVEAESIPSQMVPKEREESMCQPPMINLRQNFFGRASPSSAVEKIYLKFKEAYSAYNGDIHKFTDSCLKIQTLRSKGSLAKSILWDDFVCREVTQYRDYIQRCQNRKDQPEPYKEYFFARVTVPSFKKRNLTVKSINTISAWREEAQKQSEIIEPVLDTELTAAQRAEAFELGLRERNQNSNFKGSEIIGTQRSKPSYRKRYDSISIPDSEEWRAYETHETASIELGDTDDSHLLSGAQKRSFVEFQELEMEDEPMASAADESTASLEDSIGDAASPSQLRQSRRETMAVPEKEKETDSDESEVEEQPRSRESKGKQPQYYIDSESEHELSQVSPADDERSMDEAFYTTNFFYPPYRPPKEAAQHKGSANDTATTNQRAESPSSNWWRDPITPFKTFARAYTNLHSELGRYRRPGNAEAVPVDENGVIRPQRLLNPDNRPVEGRMKSMGWKM